MQHKLIVVAVTVAILAVASADTLAQWGNVFGGAAHDDVSAVATDSQGRVYVGGSTSSVPVSWSGYFVFPSARNFTIPFAFSPASGSEGLVFRTVPTQGSIYDWWVALSGPGDEHITDVEYVGGYLFISGTYTSANATLWVGSTPYPLVNRGSGNRDGFIAWFNIAAGGTLAFYRRIGSVSDDVVTCVSASGDVVGFGGGAWNTSATTLYADGPDSGAADPVTRGFGSASRKNDHYFWGFYNVTNGELLLLITSQTGTTGEYVHDITFDSWGQPILVGRMWDINNGAEWKPFVYRSKNAANGFDDGGSSAFVFAMTPIIGHHEFVSVAAIPYSSQVVVTGYFSRATAAVQVVDSTVTVPVPGEKNLVFATLNITDDVNTWVALAANTYFSSNMTTSWGNKIIIQPNPLDPLDGSIAWIAGTITGSPSPAPVPTPQGQDGIMIKINTTSASILSGRTIGGPNKDWATSIAVGFSDLVGVGIPRPYIYVSGAFNTTQIALGTPPQSPLQFNPTIYFKGGDYDGYVIAVDDFDDCSPAAGNLCGIPSRSWLCLDEPTGPLCMCNLNMSGTFCTNPGWNCDATDAAYYPLLLDNCNCPPAPNPTGNPFLDINQRFTPCAGDVCDFKNRGTCLPNILGFFTACNGKVTATEQSTFNLFNSFLANCNPPSSTGSYDFSAASQASVTGVVTLIAGAAALALILAARRD